jgi:hypothetical protein
MQSVMLPPGRATSRQTWAVFCATGYDVRAAGLTLQSASDLLDLANADRAAAVAQLAATPGAVLKRKSAAAGKKTHADLYLRAHQAGLAAGNAAEVVPMTVQQHANPADDASPVVQQWHVAGGVCGFAWVSVKPGNSSFAKWLVANGKGRTDHYAGGVTVWVGEFGQSMTRKEAYAYAFANTLQAAGITRAYANSRMD